MKLNGKQVAFLNTNSHASVIAGPGTGKTLALSEKIKKEATKNKNILALTFTKKAAGELESRVGHKKNVIINTFHGFCFSLLSQNKKLNLIDDYKRLVLIKSLAKKYKVEVSEASLVISRQKGGGSVDEISEKLCGEYNKLLKKEGYWDFDDLILEAMNLTKFPKYDFIFVDEFQDTNPAQYKFLQKISGNACVQVIGDPNQAIYAFRGSEPMIFGRFKKDYQSKTIVFAETYRSAEPIVATSQALFPTKTKLKTHNKTKGELIFLHTPNEFSEAEYIVADIKKSLGGVDLLEASTYNDEKDMDLSNIAILARTHFLANVIKKTLAKNNIPYQDVSGESIYLDKKVAFIIDVLRFLNGDREKVNPKVVSFAEDKYTFNKDVPLSDLVINISQKAGLKDIGEFTDVIAHYDKQKNPIGAFLNYLDILSSNNFYDPKAKAVSVMTIHAAKGLEFDCVYLLGFEKGVIPSSKAQNSAMLEEEKRLLYVALTRAKNKLVITRAKKRKNKKTQASQFYDLINKYFKVTKDSQALKKLERIKLKRLKNAQTNLFD